MATILVVEDESDLSNLIRSHLEAEGHTIRQAFDGPGALALVAEQAPQLVILDWMLPGLDGLAVCRRLRQEHLMPILMLTARDRKSTRLNSSHPSISYAVFCLKKKKKKKNRMPRQHN